MANAGFNAATDLFSMGSSWKVKSSNLNKSASAAECPNSDNDVTHRDAYGERIAPAAEYELVEDVGELPAPGTVVTIGTVKVAISSITIKTAKGAPVTASVSGVQVEASAVTKRTYDVGNIAISARHRAQDICGLYDNAMPKTVTESSVVFSADITVAEPQGDIVNHDVSNGKMVATFTHTCGTEVEAVAPTVSGNDAIVHQPVTKTSPENDYITYEVGVTKSLTGEEAA